MFKKMFEKKKVRNKNIKKIFDKIERQIIMG